MMEVKRMLRDIRISKIEIRELEEKRDQVETRAVKITRDLTGMPSAKNVRTDLSNKVVGLLELDEALKQQIEEVAKKEKTAVALISRMDSAKHRVLLTLYYISGNHPRTWEEVAREMGYSLPAVFKIHGEALLDLQRIIDDKQEK